MPTWRINYYVKEYNQAVAEGNSEDEAYHNFKKEVPSSNVITIDCHSSV
jgi:hypothetical protein